MKISEVILLELGNNALPWSWNDDDFDGAEFKVNDVVIEVSFNKHIDSADISFNVDEVPLDRKDRYRMRPSNDNEVKIMSTVAEITEAYYLKWKDELRTIHAEVSHFETEKITKKRLSLYTRFFTYLSKKYSGNVGQKHKEVIWYIRPSNHSDYNDGQ